MFNMLILYRTSYFVLFVEKLGARNSSTKFLPDVLYDDRTACAISCNRYITHCRYLKLALLVMATISLTTHNNSY